jgi:hypothetical protein
MQPSGVEPLVSCAHRHPARVPTLRQPAFLAPESIFIIHVMRRVPANV